LLSSCDIRYSEGPMSLNWANIMRTVNDDPEAFFEDGGWNFLSAESDEGEENDVESDESSFHASEDETSASSDEDEEEEEGVSEEESGRIYEIFFDFFIFLESEASLDSEEEEGKDWSDLEEEAAKGLFS